MSYVYANGQRIVTLTNNKEYYTHSDHLGSTAIVTDEIGNMVEEIGYLPFGSTLFRNSYNGSAWASAYRFTGQEFDPEYHLYNYNARLYDPIMSRFIAPDTIVPDPYNPQSLNRYSYCLNNPLSYIDPSGHEQITYDEWQAYMAILAQAYSLYEVWPQLGGIMLHDFLMGFNSFQTGFEVRAGDPETMILTSLLAGAQSSGSGGGSYQITPSNYDPHNTDPKYREDAIIAAKHYLLAKTGINTFGIKTTYVNADGNIKAHVRDDNGKTEIFNSAFSGSLAELASTIGHEKVHHDQYWGGKGILPPGNERIREGAEVVALDWQVANAAKLGLDVNPFQERRDNLYNNLSPGVRKAYDNGEYDPYK
jgi:RHS repeat-associated protein